MIPHQLHWDLGSEAREQKCLREIYNQLEVLDLHSKFSLFACNVINFEEAIKEENWVKSMDEEMDSMEWNDTW